MNVDIAYRLSKLRRDRSLSQEALANQLGVSRQAVSKWERAESSPDTDNLIALADLYGMSLDDLLKGDPEATDDEAANGVESTDGSGDGMAPSEDAADAETQQAASDASGRSYADFSDGVDVSDGGDHVHMNLRDGIHVHDHNGAEVHVGWNGIHVDDPGKGDHVDIDGSGIHVNDHDGNEVHTNDDGSVDVNGEHYESMHAAHTALHEERHKGWMSRFPYGPLALIAFLCMGAFLGMWREGLVVLFSTGVWMGLANLVDAFSRKLAPKRRRSAVKGLVGSCSLFAFLAAGLLAGLWHPGWALLLVGLAICGIIDASWCVDGHDGTGANASDERDKTD